MIRSVGVFPPGMGRCVGGFPFSVGVLPPGMDRLCSLLLIRGFRYFGRRFSYGEIRKYSSLKNVGVLLKESIINTYLVPGIHIYW